MSRLIPGEIRTAHGSLELNAGREHLHLVVVNDGDRPIQVGSHFHFADVNTALTFDRDAAMGFRLGIAAGTAVRFEPGASREVLLVKFAGTGTVPGLQLRPEAVDSNLAESNPAESNTANPTPEGA